MKNLFFSRLFKITFLAIIIIELLSWIVLDNITLNQLFFGIVIIICFLLSLKNLEWGIYIILAELVIGSKGYLLFFNINNFSVSLRLGLFLAVFVAYFIWIIRQRKILFFQNKFKNYYLALFFFLITAVIIGYAKNNELKNIFFDANGYLFFGLILPITQIINDKNKFLNSLQVMLAATLTSFIKTILLLFIFSQQNIFYYYVAGVYQWVRRSGVGEIVRMDNDFYRIFFQSHLYSIFIFFLGLSAITLYKKQELNIKQNKLFYLGFCLSILIIFTSYSRSFWVAVLGSLVVYGFSALFLLKIKYKKIATILLVVGLIFIIDYGLALGIVNFPLPGNSKVNAMSLISERTKDPTQEAAGSSRIELLKPLLTKNFENWFMGGGFGTTVTYKSQDPRAMKSNFDGNYTTYAFEWGYLDLWLKLGLIGFIVYVLLLWKIFSSGLKHTMNENNIDWKFIYFGSLLGLVALIAIHFLTPYLNHPLGIGWILLVGQFYSLDK
ncbi:MAG: O-antigen ligase family protein [Patescibacteria group bacterium]